MSENNHSPFHCLYLNTIFVYRFSQVLTFQDHIIEIFITQTSSVLVPLCILTCCRWTRISEPAGWNTVTVNCFSFLTTVINILFFIITYLNERLSCTIVTSDLFLTLCARCIIYQDPAQFISLFLSLSLILLILCFSISHHYINIFRSCVGLRREGVRPISIAVNTSICIQNYATYSVFSLWC